MQSTIQSDRLLFRAFSLDDAAAIARLAGNQLIADTTISIPHPLSETQATDWILARVSNTCSGREASFVIAKTDGELIGSIGLRDIETTHRKAELGFWVGVDFWGKGYATEAAQRMIRLGFEVLNLNRIYAHHMVRNPASGHVLSKVGMRPEGLLRQAVNKWGTFEDVVLCAILRCDWNNLVGDLVGTADFLKATGR
jgi:[ribosomal protein S5]-alanine N-acetyltransferase